MAPQENGELSAPNDEVNITTSVLLSADCMTNSVFAVYMVVV